MKIPKNHPRYNSLMEREKIEEGFEKGIVAPTGMIAHGRGETFDYLLGEKTPKEAIGQIEAAGAELLLAKKPVISVNGNTTALCAREIVQLSKTVPAPIEVNLFYRTSKRIKLIEKEFAKLGVKILGTKPTTRIPKLMSQRRFVDVLGISVADVILVMLEDGDRAEFLRRMGKQVIAIDLNPLSRTARKANITIVDNVTRALPLLTQKIKKLKKKKDKELRQIVSRFNNKKSLMLIEAKMRGGI